MNNDAEDMTQTLALMQSQAFSAAMHPHFDEPVSAQADSPWQQQQDDFAATADSSRNTSWRQGTPFRVNHRSEDGGGGGGDDSNGGAPLRITAPARLFTVQESPYTRQINSNSNNSHVNSYPSSPYQHKYSDRARAAQERRQLRRLQHAQEEAAYYDEYEAMKEFDQYNEIAKHASHIERIRAYRALCNYDGEVASTACHAEPVASAKQPAKGCLVSKDKKRTSLPLPPLASRPNCENAINFTNQSTCSNTTKLDGYSTPTSSPDPGIDNLNKNKRPFAETLALSLPTSKRVRFAPLSAAEFDATEPAHALTPLLPKQAAQLEQEIKNRRIQAEEAMRILQQERALAYNPQLHETTLENTAILNQWNNFNDGENDSDAWQQQQRRQKRRSSGVFTPSPGGRSLLDDNDDNHEDDAEDQVFAGNDDDIDNPQPLYYHDDDNQYDESSNFDEHNDSLLLDCHQEHMLRYSPAGPQSPIGQKPSHSWSCLLEEPDSMEVLDMAPVDVWNDLAVVSSVLQPPVDPNAWVERVAGYPLLLDAWQKSRLEVDSFYLAPAEMAQLEYDFDRTGPELQDRCVDVAEVAWNQIEVRQLEILHTNLLSINAYAKETLNELDQLNTSVEAAIALLPRDGRSQLVTVRSNHIDEIELLIAEEENRGRALKNQEQIMTSFLSEYRLALSTNATMTLAPYDISEEDTGDTVTISSPIHGLSVQLHRAFGDEEYRIKVFEDDEEDGDDDDVADRPYDIDSTHEVADFYRWMLTAILANAHGRDYCDGENVLDLSVTLGRLALVALDLMHVFYYHPVALHCQMDGQLLIMDIELRYDRNLHIFYDMQNSRCLTWCLPSLVQVIQSDQLAMSEPPPMAMCAMHATNVSACRLILTELCQSLEALV